ncbi:MAG TPA: phenylalanine--tRNA ligase beta subunit-related protein [Methylomirabilota bacterium]
MFFGHSPALWQQFPHLVPGVLVLGDVHPKAEVRELLEPWHARARERLARGPESELAEVSAWRRAYAQMGLKPTQYRSAAEALLRRFRREGDLPRLHPLVDLCNAISLAYALPVAVFDLAGVDSHLEVRHAAGGEEHVGFSGEIEHAEPGEVIFADAAGHAHARRWTFRQSRRSTVTADTHDVLIVAEGLHPAAGADVPDLIEALAGSLGGLWGAPRHRAVLTAAAPRLEFEA